VVPRVEHFGSYVVLRRLAIGSVGEVLRARHVSGKDVALKRLLPQAAQDQTVVAAFHYETDLTSALDHESIPRLFDRGEAGGVMFAAYELVDGRDLRTLLEGLRQVGRRLPHDLAVAVAVRISEALGHVHRCQDRDGKPLEIVHRDVSPANIMVGFDGSVKLVDFGIARSASRPKMTAKGEVRGSLRYVSPEQVSQAPLDARSDLFSLGLVLWEMLVGRSALEGSLDAVLQQVGRGNMPSPRAQEPTISIELDAIVRKVLAKAPEERYDSASFFSEALTSEATRAAASAKDGDAAPFAARLAQIMRELFPGDVGSARSEESLMADDKGSSDLDVFEGLAKKSSRPSALSGPLSTREAPPPPPSAAPPSGGTGPVSHRAPPPPPPSARPPAQGKTTLLGMPLPASTASALGLPAAASGPASQAPSGSRPPPPPPGSLRAPSSTQATPPPPAAATGPTSTPLPLPPPPTRKHSSGATVALPPPPSSMPPSGALPPPPASKVAPPVALPPPPPKDPPAAAAGIDMDWDDEEESTHVFEKRKHAMAQAAAAGEAAATPRPAAGAPAGSSKVGGSAAALVAGSGQQAARVSAPPSAGFGSVAPNTASVPPPPPVPDRRMASDPAIVAQPASGSSRRPSDEATVVRPRQNDSSGRAGVLLGALALVAVGGLAAFLLWPRTGQLKIDVKSKDGQAIPRAEIFVDGQKRCDAAPCVVEKLPPGAKSIRVIPPGEAFVDAIETVEAGKEKLVFITLTAGLTTGSAPPPTTGPAMGPATVGGTGLKVSSTQGGIKLFVDGVDRGPLLGPAAAQLVDLSAGEHKIKLDGGDKYAADERTINVSSGEVKDLGDVKLKVQKGIVTLDLKTVGASVVLSGMVDGKKVEKKLPDSVWKNPPVRIPIDLRKEEWTLIASKKGLPDFKQVLDFADGNAEPTLAIELVAAAAPTPIAAVAGPLPTGPATGMPPKDPGKAPPGKDPVKEQASSGNGTLHINSNPISKVLLDGRPIGSTPKVGVSVSAGSHTVTFIKDGERKSVTVTVKAGETKVAAVKF